MNLKYFKAPDFSNFGDELNPYIFNRLFGDVFSFEKYREVDFYGAGTVIDQRISSEKSTVFFGSGIRDVAMCYKTANWDVRFLRGPVSSNVLGFNGARFIADGAYCLLYDGSLLPARSSKRFRYSLMPHYRPRDKLNWKLIGQLTGVHIIDPRGEVVQVMQEIADSENLLSIALHGAIVADILRVPWQRIKMEAIGSESSFISDLKWMDFLAAMKLNGHFVHIRNYRFPASPASPFTWASYGEIIGKIVQASGNNRFQLSTDQKISETGVKLNQEIDLFRNQYK